MKQIYIEYGVGAARTSTTLQVEQDATHDDIHDAVDHAVLTMLEVEWNEVAE